MSDDGSRRAELGEHRRHLVEALHTASQDFDKAVTTLAAGALGISIAFVNNVAPDPRDTAWLAVAWTRSPGRRPSPTPESIDLYRRLDTTAPTLRAFLLAHVEPGSVVLTDGFRSYPSACGKDYIHRPEPIATSGRHAHEVLPGVHRVTSLAKRWLLGTHQGGVKPAHLQAYLDEFTFRFNRRHSRARGMLFYRLLEQAVQAEPRTYRSLVAHPGAGRRRTMPVPPPNKRVHCDSLAAESLDRPWRRPTGQVDVGDRP